MCDGHGIIEASRSGYQGVRPLHVHPDGDFERPWTSERGLWKPLSGRRLVLLHGGTLFPSFVTLVGSRPPLWVQGGSKCLDATPRDWAGSRPCDPCGCTVDSRSGGVKVPFNGCGTHSDRGLNGNPWCYVAGGTACKAARSDPSLPGSAWKACADQNCQCVAATAASQVEWSGVVEIKVAERGCGDHDGRGFEWCWVKKGTGCATATPATDPTMKTAAWQKCSASACDCAQASSDVPSTAVPLGCAPHFSKRDGDDASSSSSGIEISTDVCYVKGGIACSRNAVSDSVIPDVAWRDCSRDCYGAGSSFLPASRTACSCFNRPKPGKFLATRPILRLANLLERSGAQTDSKSANGSPFSTTYTANQPSMLSHRNFSKS